MNIIAVIQARMTSARLPGKILQAISGVPMLECVVRRVRRCEPVKKVVVATSSRAEDDPTAALCRKIGVDCFRGDENDVLDRFYRAAAEHRSDVVVRITADCPLIDAGVSGKVIRAFLDQRPDYASNTLERTYPRGLDTEVMTMPALERAWREAREPYQRAHVTPYFYRDPARFRLLSVKGDADYSRYRWTVDTPEDMAFVRAVYARFPGRDDFSWSEAVALLEREPALVEINRQVSQKPLQEG